MPSKLAVAKCPNLIFVRPRFEGERGRGFLAISNHLVEVYRAISAQINAVFRRYTDIIEPIALDEAYLDVTENKQRLPYASTVALHIRDEIFQETNLTASAGVSVNKFLAKIASGMNKPNGMTVILPEDAEAFVEELPIEKFHGIGKVTAAKMKSLGILTGADLKKRSLEYLVWQFGKTGNYYYNIARAKDNRAVEANRVRKSIGAENSFAEDLSDEETIILKLKQIAQTLFERIKRHQASGRTLTLKVKLRDSCVAGFHPVEQTVEGRDYQQITRSRTFENCINSLDTIVTEAVELLKIVELEGKSIRLLGISLSNLNNEKKLQIVQLSLFK